MKKGITIFALVIAMSICLFSSLGVYAADNDYYGREISAGNSLEVSFLAQVEDSDTVSEYYYEYAISEGAVKMICFIDNNYSDKSAGIAVLVYSDSPFSGTASRWCDRFENGEMVSSKLYYEKNEISINGTFYNNKVQQADCGLYYHAMSLGAGSNHYFTNSASVPTYSYNGSLNLNIILSQLADGTFEEENADDYIGGTEAPDFDQETADYVKDIGYLQNVTRKIAYTFDGDGDRQNFTEVKYRITWDSVTNTGFDVTADNVYVSFYNQVLGYKQNLPFGKKQEVVGSKVFIDKVKGSDLSMTFYQTDINEKCAEDLAKLDYTPLLQTIGRNDAEWFRIEVYHPDTGTYSYGGWVKIAEKGDGDQSATTTTWEPDPDGGDNDVQDSDGGYDDGERTPTDIGGGNTMDEAEDNMKPVDTTNDFSFTDFASILDSLADGIGQFPQLVAKVFSFLPSAFIGMLVAGLAVVIICRIIGR